MNKFFRFNDLYTEAEKFYEIKAYLTCLAYLNEALSFGITLPKNRLSEAFEFRGLIKMQLSQYLASIIDFNKAIELNPENGSIYYYRYLAHSVLSQYEEAIEDCKKLYDDFDELPEEVQQIIANMMFNMGRTRLSKFRGMKRGVDARDWNAAADEMVDSRWYRQVTNRADRLVQRMRAIA